MAEDRDDRLDDEVRFHIEEQTAKNIRAGMSPDQARRAARLTFGAVESFKEQARDQMPVAVVRDFFRDLRVAARMLRRAPGFAFLVIATLGLGIAASTTIFSVVEGVLLRPLPYPESDRIVRLYEVKDGQRANASELNILDWQGRTHVFSAIGEVGSANPSLVPVIGGPEPEKVPLSEVSRAFFDVMGVAPQVGRRFNDVELHPGSDPVAMVSDGYWRRAFGGRPLGDLALRIDTTLYRVVGVMPAGFDVPTGTSIWIPREQDPPMTDPRTRALHNFAAYGRLAPGVSLSTADRELGNAARAMKLQYGDREWMSDAVAVRMLDQITATSRPALEGLFGASLLLLLVAGTNISNLLLARAAARRHEFAVHMALGASPMRLTRQLLAEMLVLCLLGGLTGLFVASWAVGLIPTFAAKVAPRLAEVHIDWRVLLFAMAASTGAAVILAVVTAVSGTRRAPAFVLAEGTRTGTSGRRAMLAREVLVVAQVSLTLVLLAGAALLTASLTRLLTIDTGFRVDDTLVADVAGPWAGDAAGRARQVSFQDRLLQQVSALPGVVHAGLTSAFPFGGGRYADGQFLEVDTPDAVTSPDDDLRLRTIEGRSGDAGFRVVSDGHFDAMGIRLERGRLLEAGDGPDRPAVAVISVALAREHWKDRNPIGRYVQLGKMDGDTRGVRIVGVVGDVRELQLQTPGRSLVYVSSRQRPVTASSFSLVVRGGSAEVLAPEVRRVVHALAPDVPVAMRTVRGALDDSVSGQRLALFTTGLFAGSALLLATLGLYGLISFVVTQRTKEMGIRLALGATGPALIRLILRRGLALSLTGVVVGLVAARLATVLVQGLTFGVPVSEPLVLAGAAALTIVVTTLASLIPALRAARVRPASSLRAS